MTRINLSIASIINRTLENLRLMLQFYLCVLGFHDSQKSCVCTKCGIELRRDFPIDLEGVSVRNFPGDRFWIYDRTPTMHNLISVRFDGLTKRQSEFVKYILEKHSWEGCTCLKCGQKHAWALIKSETIREEGFGFIPFVGGCGKFTMKGTRICLICGMIETKEYETELIG